MLRSISVLAGLFFIGAGIYPSEAPASQPTSDEHMQSVIDKFEAYAKKAMQDWEIPGMAIAIVKDDKVIYTKGFGVRKLGDNAPVDENTVFQIGSLSKAFTSALVAMMVDDKKLKWEDQVIRYSPNFEMYDPWVTRQYEICDLFTQSSGLPEEANVQMSWLGFNRKAMIRSLRYVPPVTSFRADYAYQNIPFLVAAEVLQNVSGKSWENLIQERIFTPLGMKNTTVTMQGYTNAVNKAALHTRMLIGSKTTLIDEHQFPLEWVYTIAPAGGINSTLLDMTKWLKLQLSEGLVDNKQLISRENIELMRRPRIYAFSTEDLDSFYAMGWFNTNYTPSPIIWHTGVTSGSYALISMAPKEHLGIIILTNAISWDLPLALNWQFFDFYFNKPDKDRSKIFMQTWKKNSASQMEIKPSEQQAPLALERYAGDYSSPIYGATTFKVENETLAMTIGVKPLKVHLTPLYRDIFSFQWPESTDKQTIIFEFDAMGQVEQAKILMAGPASEAVFKKKPASLNDSGSLQP